MMETSGDDVGVYVCVCVCVCVLQISIADLSAIEEIYMYLLVDTSFLTSNRTQLTFDPHITNAQSLFVSFAQHIRKSQHGWTISAVCRPGTTCTQCFTRSSFGRILKRSNSTWHKCRRSCRPSFGLEALLRRCGCGIVRLLDRWSLVLAAVRTEQ